MTLSDLASLAGVVAALVGVAAVVLTGLQVRNDSAARRARFTDEAAARDKALEDRLAELQALISGRLA